jgi:hypothetical protein
MSNNNAKKKSKPKKADTGNKTKKTTKGPNRTRAIRGYPRSRRVKNANMLISDLDQMILAKMSPGTIDAPYVAGMDTQPVPTMMFQIGNTHPKAAAYESATYELEDLGTREYLVMATCPALTHLYGEGGDDKFPITSKLGGFLTIQADTQTGAFSAADFGDTRKAWSMVETYGSDASGFSEHGFVWASRFVFKMLAPQANIIGKAFHGRITMGQLRSNGSNQNISISQLIKISHSLSDILHGDDIVLKSAINNNNILFDNGKNITNIGEEFANEFIDYVVIQRGAANITTGAKATYSLLSEIKGNALFWPNALDSLANNLFNINDKNLFRKALNRDSHLSPVHDKIVHIDLEENPKIQKQMIKSRTHFQLGDALHKLWNYFNSKNDHVKGSPALVAAEEIDLLKRSDKHHQIFVSDWINKISEAHFPLLNVPIGVIPKYDQYKKGIDIAKELAQEWNGKRSIPYDIPSTSKLSKITDEISKIEKESMKTEEEALRLNKLRRQYIEMEESFHGIK